MNTFWGMKIFCGYFFFVEPGGHHKSGLFLGAHFYAF